MHFNMNIKLFLTSLCYKQKNKQNLPHIGLQDRVLQSLLILSERGNGLKKTFKDNKGGKPKVMGHWVKYKCEGSESKYSACGF